MADVKMSEFQTATELKDNDFIPILQDGVNKKIQSPVLESKIINKTVSRVTEQGGVSLNLINPIAVVPTYGDLALITPTPSLNDAYQVEADGLVYVYTENGFQAEGEGFKVQPNVNGVVEEGNTQAVSGGEVYENLPEYLPFNLFNPETVQVDKYVDNSGSILTDTGWICSAPIPVDQADYYLSGEKYRKGLVYLSSRNSTIGRYSDMNLGLVQPQSGETHVVFNLKSPATADFGNVMFAKSSAAVDYLPYGSKIIKETSVNKLEETIEKANQSFTVTEKMEATDSTNLLNPYTFTNKALLNSVGVPINGTTVTDRYNVSDFTKTKPLTFYDGERLDSPNIFRNVCFYSDTNDSSFLSAITSATDSFTTPANCNYIRVSVANEFDPATGVGDMKNVGIFEGEDAQWSYFGNDVKIKDSIFLEGKSDDSVATIRDVKSIIENQTSGVNGVSYNYSNGNLTLSYAEGSIVGELKNERGYSGNDMFNFVASTMKGVVVGSNDDVAPMHILNFTMGANHGYNHNIATIPAHGLTNIDIGTEFDKNGVKFYLLRIVDENTVAFISQNNGTAGSPVFVTLSTGTLTRGAETYTITARSNAQLYPSIGQLNKKLVVDGLKEITEDTTSQAEKVEVVENYVIYDPTSVLNNTIARAGQPQDPTMIGEPNVRVNNIYRFVKEPACLVFANVQFLKAIAFADIMVSQAVIIGSNNGTTQYYIPNSNPLNASVDLRKPTAITWSTSIPSTFIVNANQPDPLNPPNRVIQYRGNVGFMLCYILTRGQGKNIANYTDRTFEIRNNTGKVYPHPVEGTKVGTTTTTDSIYSVAMARVYTDLTKTRLGNRLSVFKFEVDDETHVYIDYSGSMIDFVDLEDFSLNGKSIEVLESKNTTLKNNIYNQGFVVDANYVEGETCYIVLILK